MEYSLKQAAEAVGKSKPTIQRAIKAGKISAEKDANGYYKIDVAELHRIYPVLRNARQIVKMKHHVTPEDERVTVEKVHMLEKYLEDKDDIISDLRSRLDKESEDRRKLTMMLVDQRKKRTLWGRLFGE